MGQTRTSSCRNRSFWVAKCDECDSGTLSRGATANCECSDKHRKNILEKLTQLTAAKCDFLLNKMIMEDNENQPGKPQIKARIRSTRKKSVFLHQMNQDSELKYGVLSCLAAFLLTHFVMWVRLCLQGHRSYNASHWADS